MKRESQATIIWDGGFHESIRKSYKIHTYNKILYQMEIMEHPEETCDDYDSDCLVIVEAEEVTVKDDHNVTSTSQSPLSSSLMIMDKLQEGDCGRQGGIYENKYQNQFKLHNLPIHDLKRKLAFCSVCHTQYLNHKQANLCLTKHGSRMCWICLQVMPNTKDSYFQHCVRNHAIGQSNDIVVCPYCQKFFDFRQGFNQHIVKVHFSEDISFVSTTACLSPKSLVDIFTGQPRSQSVSHKELEQDSTYEGDNMPNTSEVTTTTALLHKQIRNSVKRMTPSTNSSEGESSVSNIPSRGVISLSPAQPHLESTLSLHPPPHPSCTTPIVADTSTTSITKDNFNFKNLNFLSEPNEGNSSAGEKNPFGVMRESVIRETPGANLTPTRTHDIPGFPNILQQQQQQHHHQPQLSSGEVGQQGKHIPAKSFHFFGRSNTTSHQQLHSLPPYARGATQLLSQNPNPSNISFNPSNRLSTNTNQRMDSDKAMSEAARVRQWQATSTSADQYDPPIRTTRPPPPFYHYYFHDVGNSSSCKGASPLGDSTTSSSHHHDTNTNTTNYPSLDSFDSQPSSPPCLQEMEKLVHSTPVQIQYFNSVNSMLRTVAECNPSPTTSTTFSPTPISSSIPHLQLAPNSSEYNIPTAHTSPMMLSSSTSSQHKKSSRGRGRPPANLDAFRMPNNNDGIKRRILTKWDEHQDARPTQGEGGGGGGRGNIIYSSMVPSPTTPAVDEFSQLVDQAQVEIRTDLNPINCDLNKRRSGRNKNFWEQVIKESTSMYRGVNNRQLAQYYDESSGHSYESMGRQGSSGGDNSSAHINLNQPYQDHHQDQLMCDVAHLASAELEGQEQKQQQQHSVAIQPNYQNLNPSAYPRIMARVDPSGRPIGVFTSDGQPCLVSGYEQNRPQLLTACEMTPSSYVSEMAADNHLQYQHRIVKQVASQGSRIKQGFNQPHVSSNRKRKSSVPVRLVPTDSIIVQNPFEEEESSPKNKGGRFDKVVNKTAHVTAPIQPRPTGQPSTSTQMTVEKSPQQFNTDQSYDAVQRFISQAGRFIQPKLTSGGQITDFSGMQINPWGSGESKGAKNINNASVPNFGVNNMGNRLGGMGMGFSGPTAFSTNLQMQQQQFQAEFFGTGRQQQGAQTTGCEAGASNSTWPPFAVCQRYFDSTQNIMNRLKDLDKQKKGHNMQ